MEIRGREIPVWVQAAAVIGVFTAVLWLVEGIDAAMGHELDQYGVQPRSDEGLLGILFAPLLHGGWDHLSANSGPLLVLGFLALAAGLLRGLAATAVIWVIGGVGVWLLAGSNTNHIGASGLVFGFLVYVVVRGIVNRKLWEIVLGAVVLFIYGGVLWGVLPGQPGVSWQGHLFGAIGGAIAAVVVSHRRGEVLRSVLPGDA
ncbi:rhomboid family intramembrane serine protease [Nocardioides bizhenqiangii]|uniref:Rhomboid family intramembrane serine protease n=1 Tax=Nocardioides bizhenqiangii TaxID=3095076 RepID=A0ABZ0ZNK6_9ACTN|nr:rhomboid family intramembrane serine protease [Nocardioides sp. HM61]WQQ25903.1 rhomboid family intramembrane serine protease [Nocardioides sp. HM61]